MVAPFVQVGAAWNARLVVQHIFKEDISKKMAITGLKSSDKGWLKKFQQAVTEQISSLSKEDMQKYEEVAKKWNAGDLPEELRRK